MRALDKNLQVTSYWQPFGYSNLFEEKDEENLDVDVDLENEDEDRGSMFNDTASMHSMHSNSKHSWHSRSMQSPRSVGSQSPYQGTILEKDDPEMYSIMDVGPGHSTDMINRVPSPIGLVMHKAEQAEIDAANEKDSKKETGGNYNSNNNNSNFKNSSGNTNSYVYIHTCCIGMNENTLLYITTTEQFSLNFLFLQSVSQSWISVSMENKNFAGKKQS
mgnify:CR=1 FL=1